MTGGRDPRRHLWPLLLAGLGLAGLPFLVHPWYDLNADASIYLVCARSILAGEGYSYLGAPFTVRPPGFSLMLAPVLALAGTDFRVLNLCLNLVGLAGVLAFFLLVRRRLGDFTAALLATLLWLNPAWRKLANSVLSDLPGLLLALLCLLAAGERPGRSSWRRMAVVGALVGVATYVRMVNILLVPAIVLAALLGTGKERGWRAAFRRERILPLGALLLAAAVVVLPWVARNRLAAPGGPSDQTMLAGYETALLRQDWGDPASGTISPAPILARIPERAREVAATLGARLRTISDTRRPIAETGYLFLGLFLLGCAGYSLLRRREPADFFLWGNVLVLLVWFQVTVRLLLPVLVLALPAAVELLQRLERRFRPGRRHPWLAAAAILVLLAVDFAPRAGWPEIEERHRYYAAAAAVLERNLTPESRPGALFGGHLNVLLGRPVWSLRFAAWRGGGVAAAEKVIDRHRLDTVLFVGDEEASFRRHFEERYGANLSPGKPAVLRVR